MAGLLLSLLFVLELPLALVLLTLPGALLVPGVSSSPHAVNTAHIKTSAHIDNANFFMISLPFY
jgi:hypothetical protein